jgi:hypothetical protein
VECNVDIETEPKYEDDLTDAEQGQVPFSFIPVKQEFVSILVYQNVILKNKERYCYRILFCFILIIMLKLVSVNRTVYKLVDL